MRQLAPLPGSEQKCLHELPSFCAGFWWQAHLVWRSAVNSSGSLQSTP